MYLLYIVFICSLYYIYSFLIYFIYIYIYSLEIGRERGGGGERICVYLPPWKSTQETREGRWILDRSGREEKDQETISKNRHRYVYAGIPCFLKVHVNAASLLPRPVSTLMVFS